MLWTIISWWYEISTSYEVTYSLYWWSKGHRPANRLWYGSRELQKWSVTSIKEGFSRVHHAFLAITNVLSLSIAHCACSCISASFILTPNSNEQGFTGFGDASSTATCSTKDAEFNAILLIGSKKHVLLIADSNTALLTSFSISSSRFHQCRMLVALNLLCTTSFLWLIEIVSSQLEPLWCCPSCSIMSIHASILVHVRLSPVVCRWVI